MNAVQQKHHVAITAAIEVATGDRRMTPEQYLELLEEVQSHVEASIDAVKDDLKRAETQDD